jgi:hypothetical protein
MAVTYAQSTDKAQQMERNIQQVHTKEDMNSFETMDKNEQRTWVQSLSSLKKLHANLAESWQKLGMQPQAAQVVANAYQPNLAATIHHGPLRGKSDAEIAAMLQSALSKKDYVLADQLLIDYQRERLQLASHNMH